METILIKAAQLVLAFAFLVIIHEFGHFLFARIFGVRVEKFYIFFNPWFSLFKYKSRSLKRMEAEENARAEAEKNGVIYVSEQKLETNGKKHKGHFWNETEYGIGWLPLGGYCKIAGMIDESMDKEQMQRPPQPWEFRSKPAWQRLLIMVAGVLFNFLLAILIYSGIVYVTGEEYVPFSEAKDGMVYSPAAHNVGFCDGDIPLTADGKRLESPMQITDMIQAKQVTVLRGKDTVGIDLPEKFIFTIDDEAKEGKVPFTFMAYSMPAEFTKVMNGEGAAKAGAMEGDRVVAIDGKPVRDIYTFLRTVKGHANKTIGMTVVRRNADRIDTLTLQVPLNGSSQMGVMLQTDPTKFYHSRVIRYNLLTSVPRGVQLGTDKLTTYVSSMKMVFSKEGVQSIGGFGTIGSIFPEKWDWIAFWNITAFLSVALAFMNILPIPALDGGHVMFLLYEVIFRRKPSEKFMEYAQYTGMILLLLLLLYANGMDIVRLFK